MKQRIVLSCLFVLGLLSAQLHAQIQIENLDQLDRIKNGTTYIVMKNPEAEKSQPYIEIFKKYWTISDFKFIKYSEIENYIAEENSFFTIGGYETNTQFMKLYSDGSQRSGINYSNTHLYLELWLGSEKYFKKKKGEEFEDDDKVQVARIELFTDFVTLSNPDFLYFADYDHNYHIRNWSPGVLKNYLQTLSSLLDSKKERSLFENIHKHKDLKKLKRKTLYVPDYTLIKFNKFTGNESKRLKEEKIFKKYPFKYKLIDMEDLSKKILDPNEEPFYYLIYIKSSTDKFLTVINSQTGEWIYTDYSPISYNIKDKDLKELAKKIGKKKKK